jgi:hypothetical protein
MTSATAGKNDVRVNRAWCFEFPELPLAAPKQPSLNPDRQFDGLPGDDGLACQQFLAVQSVLDSCA